MNSLHILYIESVLGIKLHEFSAGVAEFTGHLTLEAITDVCARSGSVFWQNPDAPIIDKAYLSVPVDGEVIQIAVDFNLNTLYVVQGE